MPTPSKYPELQNVLWVFNQLSKSGAAKSMAKLAEEVGCPASCIRWVVMRKMSPEQRAELSYDRKPHVNKKRTIES